MEGSGVDSAGCVVHVCVVLGVYSMLECKLCCEILLLLDMADMDCLLC